MSAQDVKFIVVVLALVFLFQGDPDVWDRMHNAAMSAGCVK